MMLVLNIISEVGFRNIHKHHRQSNHEDMSNTDKASQAALDLPRPCHTGPQ